MLRLDLNTVKDYVDILISSNLATSGSGSIIINSKFINYIYILLTIYTENDERGVQSNPKNQGKIKHALSTYATFLVTQILLFKRTAIIFLET